MQEQEQNSTTTGLWSALAAGFDLTAKHPWLLLLPMLLDVFIWLGPRLRFQRIIEQLVAELPPEVEVMELTQQLIAVGPFTNLFSVLSVPIIGVPALLAGLSPQKTPLSTVALDISNGSNWLLLALILSLVGLFFSAVYYLTISSVVSRRYYGNSDRLALDSWFTRIGTSWLRLIGLSFLFFLMALIVYIPISIIGALFFLISPMLGTMALLVAPFIIIWVVIYLSFAPPSITLNNRTMIQAVKESVRLVQTNLPLVLLMLMLILLLGTLVDWLLVAAENGTWFTLFNILIHAFVNTGFVTAFFILYQDRSAVLSDSEKVVKDGYI
jgi:hypothetical protein